MHKLPRIAALTLLAVGTGCAAAWADGGVVQFVGQQGACRISVFTSPAALRAGPIDISVLLQDAASGQPVPDAQLLVALTSSDVPQCKLAVEATTEAATNKLLRVAPVDVPSAGRWQVVITGHSDHGPIEIEFAIDVGPAGAHGLAMWRSFAWPGVAILLFGIHRGLVARRAGIADLRGTPPTPMVIRNPGEKIS